MPAGKKQQNRPKGTPYIRADGQPHASTGSNIKKGHENRLLPARNACADSPAMKLMEEMGRQIGPSFDPADPNSIFHDAARKFTAAKKIEFLEHVAQHGILTYSAHRCGVTYDTVVKHRQKDPKFDEFVKIALQYYTDSTVAVLKQQAIFGIPEYKYDKEGNVISFRVNVETRLRELMIKRYAPEFNETQKQELTVQGGAVLVPTPTADVSNWASVVAQLESGGPPVDGFAANGGQTRALVETTGHSIADAPEALGEADEDSLGNVSLPTDDGSDGQAEGETSE